MCAGTLHPDSIRLLDQPYGNRFGRRATITTTGQDRRDSGVLSGLQEGVRFRPSDRSHSTGSQTSERRRPMSMTETNPTRRPRTGVADLRAVFRLAGAVALASLALGAGLPAGPAQAARDQDTASRVPLVIGGNLAPETGWPSQTALLRARSSVPSQAQFCAGTLIERRWVLTAAHCMFWPPDTAREGQLLEPSDLDVAVGINDLRDVSASDRIEVQSIRVNPNWDRSTDRWDFALLRLGNASDRPTTDLIEPGQEALTAGGQPAEVAGWGCTGQSGGECTEPRPNRLIEAEVSFITNSDCSNPGSYGAFFDPVTMVCAGNLATGTPDTCYGDSGGPLVALGPGGERVLAGVTSWGEQCALPGYPGVYARVSAARNWILRVTAAQPKPKVSFTARPAKRATRSRAIFGFRASPTASFFRCRLDRKAWRRCSSPKTYRNLARGRRHTVRVKATRNGTTGPVRKYTWFVKRR